MKSGLPLKISGLLLLAAAGGYSQNQCRLDLANQSGNATSGFTLSLVAAADPNGNCQLGSVQVGLNVGDGKSSHTVQAPFSWQTGVVYTVTAVLSSAGPQQLSIDGQSAGSVVGGFTPAPGTFYASNVNDTGTATEAYIVTQISLQVSNGSNSLTVTPNGTSPVPLPLVLLAGGPVPWQTALTVDPTKTTTVTATFEFNATVANPHQFDPYIDVYGQAVAASWPSKITSDSDLLATVTEEQAWLASNPPVAALDPYGGSTIAGWTGHATGYYSAAFHSAHWYMISPAWQPAVLPGPDLHRRRPNGHHGARIDVPTASAERSFCGGVHYRARGDASIFLRCEPNRQVRQFLESYGKHPVASTVPELGFCGRRKVRHVSGGYALYSGTDA